MRLVAGGWWGLMVLNADIPALAMLSPHQPRATSL
jgi:hypothetical protein